MPVTAAATVNTFRSNGNRRVGRCAGGRLVTRKRTVVGRAGRSKGRSCNVLTAHRSTPQATRPFVALPLPDRHTTAAANTTTPQTTRRPIIQLIVGALSLFAGDAVFVAVEALVEADPDPVHAGAVEEVPHGSPELTASCAPNRPTPCGYRWLTATQLLHCAGMRASATVATVPPMIATAATSAAPRLI